MLSIFKPFGAFTELLSGTTLHMYSANQQTVRVLFWLHIRGSHKKQRRLPHVTVMNLMGEGRMVSSCLFFLKGRDFPNVFGSFASLCSGAVHVLRKASLSLARPSHRFFLSGQGQKESFSTSQIEQEFPKWLELESLIFWEVLLYFNVLVIRQRTGPYSSGYGGFLTIPWNLSEVWS